MAVAGDARLGGRDWDLLLAEHLAGEFTKQFGEDPRYDMVSVRRLVESAEEARLALTARQQARVSHCPSLGIRGRQQCGNGADAARAEPRRERPPQRPNRRIADRQAAPGHAAAAQSAKCLSRLLAPKIPSPLPRHQRPHDAQQRHRARTQAGRQPSRDLPEVGDAVQPAEVRKRAIKLIYDFRF